jgi:cell division protease FtsH
MGAERRSMVVSDKDRKRTAYHEAGHAIVAHILPESDRVHKVTITPRGRAMGLTWFMPEERFGSTYKEFKCRIATAMGGRAAEKVILNEVSTGASNDIKQASDIAVNMVTKYGMSKALGPVNWAGGGGEVFLGRDYGKKASQSETTAAKVDEEVRSLVQEGDDWARRILVTNIHILHKVAQILLEEETVDGERFREVVIAMEPVLPEGVGVFQ